MGTEWWGEMEWFHELYCNDMHKVEDGNKYNSIT